MDDRGDAARLHGGVGVGQTLRQFVDDLLLAQLDHTLSFAVTGVTVNRCTPRHRDVLRQRRGVW
ncbi:hypothetical protein MPSYJ_41840 [Mycolicibacterium psychrotolerans]|uniref:Uncharacterized protein n=1 Tax=Mycolicibacterium psychrotolerans TaxID=216929 RepID=A0A7I7MGR1_9MYCO|nr:hypothetical protein MPSYJ_41840 [Mycolicibacterium psychrotolerans]